MFKRSFERLAVLPWAKTLKVAGWFVAGFTFLVGVPAAGLSYTNFSSFLVNVAVTLVVAMFLALYGVGIFTYTWATSDVPQRWENFKKFWREFPENWRWFWRGVGAVLYWLLMLPFTIGRGLQRFWRWLRSVPARWHATPSRDKQAAAFTALVFAIMGGVGYGYWGLASRWANALPQWLLDGDVLVPTMFIDAMLTAFTVIFGMAALGIAFDLLRLVWRRSRP